MQWRNVSPLAITLKKKLRLLCAQQSSIKHAAKYKKELISIWFFIRVAPPRFFTLAFFSSLTHPRIGVPIATTSKVKLLQIKIEHLV
jgi:hypothetical protein